MIYLITIKNSYRFEEMKKLQAKRNFSAKREAIYQTLASTKAHPTAEWVYEQLKPKIPDLSLGTVYRNISVFREMGLAKSVGVVNGQERFDTDMSKHSHFVCSKCFKIMDVPKGKNFVDSNIYEYVERECKVKIENHSIMFYGICRDCESTGN